VFRQCWVSDTVWGLILGKT